MAQQYPTVRYTTLNGLPNNAVRSLFVDSRGLLWVGTENGISVKENGRFLNFFTDDGLAFGSCWAIVEDSKGQMWFGSYGGGVTKFDGEKFTSFPLDSGLIDARIRHFFPYKEKIFVGTENGLSVIDIQTDKITSIQESILNSPQSYISGFFLHKGILYYTTYGMGLYRFDPEQNEPRIEKVNDHKLIFAIGVNGSKIYLSNKGHIDEFDIEDFITGKKPLRSFGQSIIWDYLQIEPNQFYLAAWGIYANNGGVFNLQNEDLIPMSHIFDIDSSDLLSIAYNADKHRLYLGSLKQGVYAVNLDKNILYYDFEDKEIIDFSFDKNQKAILYEDGIFIKSFGDKTIKTLNKFDLKKVVDKYLVTSKNKIPKYEDDFYEMDYQTAAEDVLFYELKFNQNSYWISSNIGVFQIGLSCEILNYVPVHTFQMGFTHDGKFIETNPYGGVRIYEEVSKMDYVYFPFQDESNTPTNVSEVLEYGSKTYFSSVFEGLFHFDKDGFYSYKKSGALDISKIKQMHITKDGNLILATEFDAIYVTQEKDGLEILETIDRSKIIGKTVLFIESYQDHLLIGTELGLNIYHNGNVRVLDDEQGLIHMLFRTGKVEGDLLYIGTNRGYYTLHLPFILQPEKNQIRLAVSHIEINQEPVPKEDYSWFTYKYDKLRLPHEKNTILLEFKPLGSRYPEKLTYRYRLRAEDEWSPYSPEPQLFLSYLPAGNYQIEVEVFDQYTGQRSVATLFNLQILRPFYQNPWIILLIVLLIIGLTFLIYKARIRKLRRDEAIKLDIQMQLSETKLEALRSQMNPHFIFNAINSIQYYILNNDVDLALEFMGKFSKLIRKTLSNSSQAYISLAEEIIYLETYTEIENERMGGRVNWSIEVEEGLEIKSLGVPPMLVQPIIENVFVHAFPHNHPNPVLQITFRKKDEHTLLCIVNDNGVGIKKIKTNQLRESKGMELVNKRISLIFGEEKPFIEVVSTNDSGTEVQVQIPSKAINSLNVKR